jgi:hypothetical protein
MDTLQAFAMGQANKGNELKVFDWDKAAKLIKKEKPEIASAGLQGDWEYTGGEIFKCGKPIPKEDTYVYLASTWATPELDMDGNRIDCYKMQSKTPNWDSDTYWPDSAVTILKS